MSQANNLPPFPYACLYKYQMSSELH